MSKVEIFLFRHGETDWNRAGRFQGHTDIPLNQTGRDQAKVLAEKIYVLKPQVIVTSDLSRARETAEIVNRELNLPIHVSDQLRECGLGTSEGLHQDRIKEIFGTQNWMRWKSVRNEDLDFGFPTGETKQQQLDRVIAFLIKFCTERKEHSRFAVSTHGGALQRLLHFSEGAPDEPVLLPNCTLIKIHLNLEQNTWTYLGKIDGESD